MLVYKQRTRYRIVVSIGGYCTIWVIIIIPFCVSYFILSLEKNNRFNDEGIFFKII